MTTRPPTSPEFPELTPLLCLIPPETSRLLLVGCGDGSLGAALALARPGLQVTGLTPSATQATQAARSLAVAHCWDPQVASELPRELDTPFDAIVALELFARERPGEALGKILPALIEGGAVVVGAPSPYGQQTLMALLTPGVAEGMPPLPATGRAHEVETALAAAGLAVSGREEVRLPLSPEVEAILAAAPATGPEAADLRARLEVIGHLWRADAGAAAALQGDEAYQAVRAAIAAAVAGARRAGVVVGVPVAGAATGDAETEAAGGPPRVSVVIPVYNQASYTEACLYAIAANTGAAAVGAPDYEVIVVDNGSEDWTMYLLHAMEGDIRVIGNDRNLGFARACNQGAAEARGEYVLFLNNDTVPHDGWLQPLVELADGDPRIGVVGAKLLYPDTGRIQHAGLAMVNGVPEHVHRGLEADDPRVDGVRDLDMVTGACMMVRRDLFEHLGGFDTQYLNGVEDVDLCLRARDAGYRVVYCPASVVNHHEAVSDGRFDNVRENVRRFLDTWADRFDADGCLVPVDLPASPSPAPAPPLAIARPAPAAPAERYRGLWEGSFFLHSSLAYVNRELVLALLGTGQCDLGLLPFEPDQFGLEEDPERFGALAARMNQPLAEVDFHLRHRWPPELSRPPAGRFVLMQPWEFGRIPRSWVEPIRQSVDQVWAYTEYVRSCYVDSGIDPARVHVVPLGIDPERFHPGLDPLDLATDRSFRFLFVGGTLYRKGIDLLLEAYRRAFTAADDVCLVIKDMGVNTFYRSQTAGERIRQLQADDACAEILYMTQDLPGKAMPQLYAAAHALVHPYRGEGFGLPVAEAMACGLPVVVTAGGACDDFCPADLVYQVPAVRQVVRFQEETAGEAWQLAPDLQALADHLRSLYDHRTEAADRGRRASDHIRTHFSWAQAAAKALEALAALDHPQLAHPQLAHPQLGRRLLAPAPPTPPEPQSAVEPDPSGVAVIVLDAGEPADLTGFTAAFGDFDRYDVTPGPEHALGAQLEAIRQSALGRQVLAVVRSDVDASEVDVKALAQYLEDHDDVGMVSPRSGGDADEADGIWYPEAACALLRTEALVRCGGFDTAFQTAAVLANAARCLRRVGARVAAPAGVIFTEAERPATILRFGGGAPAPALEELELAAVRAVEEGDERRDAGQLREAADAYGSALEAKGDFVEAILVLADVLVDDDRAAAAVEVIERLPDLDQQSSWAHNYAGIVCHRADHIDAARGHFVRAVELQPDLIEARVNLGVLEWDQGQGEAAVSQFRQASDLDPSNRELVANLSLIYQKMGQLDQAAGVLRDYLTTHPDDAELQVQLGQFLLSLGDAEGARRAAESVLGQHPDDVEASALLASAGPVDGEPGDGEETP